MTRKYSFVAQFPAGAVFHENPALLFYRSLLGYIRKLSCFNSSRHCRECPECKFCQFYRLTGEYFQEYPAILVQIPVFYRQIYAPGDRITLDVYFIGNVDQSCSFVELYFQSHDTLQGAPFFLKQISEEEPACSFTESLNLRILTPVEDQDAGRVIQNMLLYYNRMYGTSFETAIPSCSLKNAIRVSLPETRICGRNIHPRGITGLAEGLQVPQFLLKTGIGKWNITGGGQVEIESGS